MLDRKAQVRISGGNAMAMADMLRRYPFFEGLTEEQLGAVSEAAAEVRVPAGAALFFEGQPADTLWLVVEGGARLRHSVEAAGAAHARTTEAVYHLIEEGAPIPLLEGQSGVYTELDVGEAAPGEIVGISALIAPYRLTATARASVDSRMVRVDAERLRTLCAADSALACALLQATAQVALKRLHFTRQQLLAERQ
jgi:CRP-like cAMP-binding protein